MCVLCSAMYVYGTHVVLVLEEAWQKLSELGKIYCSKGPFFILNLYYYSRYYMRVEAY